MKEPWAWILAFVATGAIIGLVFLAVVTPMGPYFASILLLGILAGLTVGAIHKMLKEWY